MKNIRNRLFETNSSSTHSLVIAPDLEMIKQFKPRLNKDGMIEVDGWDQLSDHVAYGFYEKLSYMLSWMYLRENGNPYWREDDEEIDDMTYPSDYFDSNYEDEYDNILKVIQKHYPEVKGIRLTNVSNISWDHQTMPYESDFIVCLWNEDEIEGYLFNDAVKVIVGRD